MDDTHYAESFGSGFIRLLPSDSAQGSHFIRAAHVVAIQPQFAGDQWICCEVITIDGSKRRVNASVEQIIAAMEASTGQEG